MLKNICRNVKERNFVIIISIFTISLLLLISFAKVLTYSNLEFFNNSEYTNLSSSVEYLILDGSQNLDINQITNDFESKFIQNPHKSIHFSNDVEKAWLKLKLQGNQTDIKNILYIDCEFISSIDIYIPTTAGKFISVKPKEYLIYPYTDFPENTDFTKDIYINLNWPGNVFNLLLAKDSNFYINQSSLTYFYVINLCILLGMIIMNMVLFFSSNDSKYLFHSLFTGSFLVLLYCLSGMQSLVFGFITSNKIIILGAMVVSTWILFLYSYIDIKNNIPRLNIFFNILLSLLMLLLYMSEIIPSGLTYIIVYFYLFITGISIIISLYSYFKLKLGSIYYFSGIFILFTGIILYTFASNGLLEWNLITANAWYPACSIETLLFTIGIIKQIKNEKERNDKLEIEVVTDKLTHLYNRRYFDETVKNQIINLDMNNNTVSMLLLDIDHFKNVNDTYGHNVGDSVLTEIAMLIGQCLRKDDILVRWGGEEFVAILPFSNIKDGIVIAEKIRTAIEEHIFKYVDKVTVSIGVSEKISKGGFDDWFKETDEAMYKAKESGRNRVCICSSK